ncbi:deoxyribose-phosphate aldolase [Bacteroidales bacterium OttesenSCG-928-A17]|nr:deoxyribose-phosphate aldolase [Bacteroidales bacterium OttesenSCG-928-A17]
MDKYQEVFSKFNLDQKDSEIAEILKKIQEKKEENRTEDVLKLLYSCIDLTSLNTNDGKESIWKFVEKVNEFDGSRSDMNNVAAICVYPNFVPVVKDALTAGNVKVASVAAGFPSSQTFIEIKIAETSLAIGDGADEIDIVLNIGDFLENNYEDLTQEIEEIKLVCKEATLKVILETGLLGNTRDIKKASILAMYSGADFIKTSTGKVYPGATPEAFYAICDTVKTYYNLHKKKIGVKVSGGVRSVEDALSYYTIVKETLGSEWLTPSLFRIGASGLADNLLKVL